MVLLIHTEAAIEFLVSTRSWLIAEESDIHFSALAKRERERVLPLQSAQPSM